MLHAILWIFISIVAFLVLVVVSSFAETDNIERRGPKP